MSRYSGKCDVYDSLIDIREITDFSKLKVYAAGHELVPLRIDSIKELAPYFPYATSIMHGGSDGELIIHLSKESATDSKEQNFLEAVMNNVKRYYRKCKREKKDFDREKALKQIVWPIDDTPQQYEIEIVDRVALYGEKATVDGIHMPLHDHNRQALYEDMIELGWAEGQAYRWCFGWDRWLDRERLEQYGERTE